MKAALILVVMFAAFGPLAAGRLSAQEPSRVQFGKGKSSAVVAGNTGSYGV